MRFALSYILARLREPSTHAGLAALAVLAGLDHDKAVSLVEFIGSAAGLAAVLLPEVPLK